MQRQRVEFAMLGVRWVFSYRWSELRKYAATHGTPWPLSSDAEKEVDAFEATAQWRGLLGDAKHPHPAIMKVFLADGKQGSETIATIRALVDKRSLSITPNCTGSRMLRGVRQSFGAICWCNVQGHVGPVPCKSSSAVQDVLGSRKRVAASAQFDPIAADS